MSIGLNTSYLGGGGEGTARNVFHRAEHAPLGSKNLQEQEEATLESQVQLKRRAGDKCFFLLPFREN